MSGQFFHKQFSALSANYQCIRLDLRGHGESDKVLHGHTISQYARDVREFLNAMELDHVVLDTQCDRNNNNGGGGKAIALSIKNDMIKLHCV